jgi:hypothetical protein
VHQRFDGSVCIGSTSWLQGEYSIIEGGAIAIIEAMKEVVRRCFANVIFKTDSKSVVDATRCLRFNVSKFSSLICKIKRMVVHKLAIVAVSWSNRYVLFVLNV